jgi:anti-anti-sigma factor
LPEPTAMIAIHPGAHSTVVDPSGDIDLASSMHIRRLIAGLVEPGLRMVIDLQHVSFVDPVGLSALVGAVRRVQAAGATMSFKNADPRLQRLLGLTGGERLRIQPSSRTKRLDAA